MMTKEQKDKAFEMLEEGHSTQEIAEALGVTGNVIGGMKAQLARKAKGKDERREPKAEETITPMITEEKRLGETDQLVVKLIRDMLDVIRKIYGV